MIAWLLNYKVPAYKIKEHNRTPVEIIFYEPEMQKVNVAEDDYFQLGKVLKRSKGQTLIQWKGCRRVQHLDWRKKTLVH